MTTWNETIQSDEFKALSTATPDAASQSAIDDRLRPVSDDHVHEPPAAVSITVLNTRFFGDNENGAPVMTERGITLLGWTCFGPDEAGQKALREYVPAAPPTPRAMTQGETDQ